MNNHIPSYEEIRESLRYEQNRVVTFEDIERATRDAGVPHLANAFRNQLPYTSRED